jgi:TonB-dependent receptor
MLKMIRILVLAMLGFSSTAYSQDEPLEEVTVVGVRSSIQSALDNKRKSDVIMDGISADDIGNFPDLNLAESLQRVTGVQMDYAGDEGLRRMGRVAIRGLPTEYSVTTYNGQFLGAPRPDFGYSFGNAESGTISEVNVLKTTTARMNAGGLAGTIDIRSRRALDVDEPYLNLGLKTTYETNLEDHSPGYSLAFGSKFADDRWGVIGSLSASEQHFRGDVVRVNSYSESDTDGDGFNDYYVPNQVRLISRDTKGARVSAPLGLEFQASDNFKLGLNALYVEDPFAHDWAMLRIRRASSLVALESISDPKFGETVTRVNFVNPEVRAQQRLIEVRNETQALTLDGEWSNEDWTITGTVHRTEASQFAYAYMGRRIVNGRGLDNGITVLVDTGEGNVNNFEFREASNAFADINTYSNNGCTAAEIAAGRTESRCVNTNAGAGDWYTTYTSGHEYDTTDDENAFQLDVIRHFDNSVITTVEGGIKFRDTEQNFVRPEWELPNDEFDYSQIPNLGSLVSLNDFTSGNGESFFGGRLGSQIDNFYFQAAGPIREALVGDMTFPEPTLGGLPYPADLGDIPNQTASSERDIFSAYVMTTFDFSNMDSGASIRGNAGLRYVDTDRTAYGYRNPRGDFEPISASTTFDHLLPSLNLMWDLRDDLVLRASYSETIVRPHTWNFRVHQFTDVTESSPGVVDSIEFDLGNADLEPFEADSIDFSLEWYNDVGSAITLAYFQKKVSNGFDDRVLCPANINDIPSIADSNEASLITGSLAPDSSGICVDGAGVEVLITDTVNTPDSFDIDGFEFGIFQTFDFLDVPVLRNMGIQANYTYVDTSEGPDKDGSGNRLPLAGVSEDTYNLIAFYEAQQVAVRFAYTNRSDYFDETVFTVSGDNRFIDTQDRLDMQVSYNPKQLENLFFTLEVFNLTDEQFYAYQGTEKRFREAREVGRTWSLQALYKFEL